MKRRFDIFSKVETIECIRKEYIPKVEEFSRDIDAYLLDNAKVKEVVRKLDEDLSMKANWACIKVLKEETEKNYFKK